MSQLIYSLIPKIMTEVGAVGKDGKNTHQNYKFRGIDQLYNAFHPVLAANGVFCVPCVLDSQSQEIEREGGKVSFRVLLRVSHKFFASDGSFIEAITVGEGIDTSDKASNKAMSAAMKYAFIETFSIPTEDIDDGDADSPSAGKVKSAQSLKVASGGSSFF